MLQRFGRLVAVLVVGLLAAEHLAAEEETTPAPGADTVAVEPEPLRGWLDEVRAQRQAREERRRAAKEAIDARRRWIDPWGAAQKEAREQEVQRRRDALLEKIEREREVFRKQIPWVPKHPWEEETSGPGAVSPAAPETATTGTLEHSLATPSPYALPGWDNRWYYRGY